MTSTVTNYSNNIDTAYPVAGVDNDTQGFRDNFTNIKNSLRVASAEITDLQLTTVKLNTGTNDFNYYSIFRASLIGSGESSPAIITINTNTTVSFYQGSYQPVSVGGNVTLSVTDWPPVNTKGAVQFEIYNYNTVSRTLTFSAGAGNTLKVDNGITAAVSLSSTHYTNPLVYEMWTRDGGETVFLRKIGGPFT